MELTFYEFFINLNSLGRRDGSTSPSYDPDPFRQPDIIFKSMFQTPTTHREKRERGDVQKANTT